VDKRSQKAALMDASAEPFTIRRSNRSRARRANSRRIPKIAGRLGLDSFECGIPYVEPMLEGLHFLARASVEATNPECPPFTQNISYRLIAFPGAHASMAW